MKKILVSIGVFTLVVLLPAGSWYYLKTGLDYRKAALVKLEPKGKFDQSLIGAGAPLQSLTSVIEVRESSAASGQRLYEQFGEGETFTLWADGSAATSEENWRQLTDEQKANLQQAYPDISYMIVDTTGTIRSMYGELDHAGVKEMVSHIAIVMPRKKEKDIKMKNK